MIGTETIPYISFAANTKIDKLSLSIQADYSALVAIESVDNHILRSKRIDFSSQGTYMGLAIQADYAFSKNWTLGMGYNYSLIESHGSHTQTRYSNTTEGDVGVIGTGTQNTETIQQIIRGGVRYVF